MHLLQVPGLSHLFHFIIGTEQVLGFTKSQIEVELPLAVQVVVLDVLADEIIDLILDLFLVAKVNSCEREPGWQTNLPLYRV